MLLAVSRSLNNPKCASSGTIKTQKVGRLVRCIGKWEDSVPSRLEVIAGNSFSRITLSIDRDPPTVVVFQDPNSAHARTVESKVIGFSATVVIIGNDKIRGRF